MIWYNFRLILRRITNNRAFSALSILGLFLGISSFFILSFHVTNEKSYDKHFKDCNNIYRVISTPKQSVSPWARSLGFIKEASATFPEIEKATQFTHCPNGIINIGEQDFQQKDIMSVDKSFIDMFSVESLSGDLSEITEPNTVFITEEFAKKHYKNEKPIGKTIDIKYLGHRLAHDLSKYEIRGIIKNTPPKTHFNYNILLSQKGALEKCFAALDDSKIHWVYNYISIKSGVSPSVVAEKLLSYYNSSSFKQTLGPKEYLFTLTPLTDIHLKSNNLFELKESNSKINIRLFIVISFVILFVSLLNFVNLTSARLIKRTKELGLKKVIGANAKQLVGHVLTEISLLCSISIIISLIFLELTKPFINHFFDIDFTIYYSEPLVYLNIIGVLSVCIGFSILFLGILLVRKTSTIGMFSKKKNISGNAVMKSLMIAQITVVIILMSSTFLVGKQIIFIFDKPLGFKKENVVVLNLKDRSKDHAVFANELKRQSQVVSVGFTGQYFGYPTQSLPLNDLGIDGNVAITFANYDYLKTMNIELAESWFEKSSDNISGMIVNEHLYRKLMNVHGSMDVLKKNMSNKKNSSPDEPRMNNIIGVAKDFNYSSAHEKIGDFAFVLGESRNIARFIHVRLSRGDLKTAVNKIKEIWNTHYPDQEFDYFFIDEKIGQQYKAEVILGRFLSTFSVIGILISIIGISALSLFISQQRTKEIGIRKVNGAKISEVLVILYKDFVKWVIIAFMIATPLAYFTMNKWLENFAYKTNLSWWIFAIAGLLALGIALITVSIQSWKVARRNPIEALRYE